VINTNLPPILHLFRDIAFDRSKIAIFFSTPLRLNPPTEGFPGTISVKLSVDVNGWPSKVPNGVETLQKISTGWVGRTNVTDRRQTELRQHIANLNVSSRSLKTTSNLDLLDGRSIGFLFFFTGVLRYVYMAQWYIESRSLTGEPSLSDAWSVADGWRLMWVSRPL